MGVGYAYSGGKKRSSSTYDSYVANPNPDPNRFEIIKHEIVGKWLILLVKYLNCTNFEGKKILVYKDVDIMALWKQKSLDPHFSNNKQYHSPVARFVPTDEGWNYAKRFVANV